MMISVTTCLAGLDCDVEMQGLDEDIEIEEGDDNVMEYARINEGLGPFLDTTICIQRV
jgi:hypothetical protein